MAILIGFGAMFSVAAAAGWFVHVEREQALAASVTQVAEKVLTLEAQVGQNGPVLLPPSTSWHPFAPWIVPHSQAEAFTRWLIQQDWERERQGGPRVRAVAITLTAAPTVTVEPGQHRAQAVLHFAWTRQLDPKGSAQGSGTLREWLVSGARGWQVEALLFQFGPDAAPTPAAGQALEELWQVTPPPPPPFGLAPTTPPLPPTVP